MDTRLGGLELYQNYAMTLAIFSHVSSGSNRFDIT